MQVPRDQYVAPGVRRIELPLPIPALKSVNVYLVEGDDRSLVDAGLHTAEAEAAPMVRRLKRGDVRPIRAMTVRRVRTWNQSVYDVVRRIPRGRVATYGQLAALLGRPRGGREVGWALSGCDDPKVPCHRVVDRNGRLAPHFADQRSRLRREGVAADRTAVYLDTYRWEPTRAMQIQLGREADDGL